VGVLVLSVLDFWVNGVMFAWGWLDLLEDHSLLVRILDGHDWHM